MSLLSRRGSTTGRLKATPHDDQFGRLDTSELRTCSGWGGVELSLGPLDPPLQSVIPTPQLRFPLTTRRAWKTMKIRGRAINQHGANQCAEAALNNSGPRRMKLRFLNTKRQAVRFWLHNAEGNSTVRGKSHERVPAGSDHFLCLTDLSQSVASFPCVRK